MPVYKGTKKLPQFNKMTGKIRSGVEEAKYDSALGSMYKASGDPRKVIKKPADKFLKSQKKKK